MFDIICQSSAQPTNTASNNAVKRNKAAKLAVSIRCQNVRRNCKRAHIYSTITQPPNTFIRCNRPTATNNALRSNVIWICQHKSWLLGSMAGRKSNKSLQFWAMGRAVQCNGKKVATARLKYLCGIACRYLNFFRKASAGCATA